MNQKIGQLLIGIFLFCLLQVGEAQIHYVKVGGTGDGSSWENASGDLQEMIDSADVNDKIWIAEGTYYPTECSTCNEGDRDSTFQFRTNVSLYGGFSGPDYGTVLTDRNWVDHPSILSGDIGNSGDNSDNSHHVATVFSGNINFDGITISYGNANDALSASINGGGLLSISGRTRLKNCSFFNNNALGNGGAFYNERNESTIELCIFENNTAAQGGAVFMTTDDNDDDVRITSSSFKSNNALNNGGSIYIGHHPYISIQSCLFHENDAPSGGAIYMEQPGSFSSGGSYPDYSKSKVMNCTFVNNTASEDGSCVHVLNLGSDLAIANNILWSNQSPNISVDTLLSNNSEVLLAGTLTNALSADSLGCCNFLTEIDDVNYFNSPDPFLDLSNNDFRLYSESVAVNRSYKHIEGYCADSAESDDFTFDIGSGHDLLNHPRVVTRSDIGAYEFYDPNPDIPIVYVNQNASGSNNGLTWVDAYTTIEEALNRARNYNVNQIWIAAGTYKPSTCAFANCGQDSTRFTFTLSLGNEAETTMYGGFPNSGNPTLADRDWNVYPTIISGEIGDPNSLEDNMNVMHRPYFSSYAPIIDGLTFTRSRSVAIDARRITIRNSIFIDNPLGAEIVNIDWGCSGLGIFDNCTFINNQTGIYVEDESRIELSFCHFSNHTNSALFISGRLKADYCSFTNNTSPTNGGAIRGSGGDPINHCRFINNSALDRGGAIYGSMPVRNSLFVGNSSSYGAVQSTYSTSYTGFTNCTFYNNNATNGGSVFHTQTINSNADSLPIVNCILWDNEMPFSYGSNSPFPTDFNIKFEHTLSNYENCTAIHPNANCVDLNLFDTISPFVDTVNYDFQLIENSIAIDAGINEAISDAIFDLNHLPRIDNDVVDLGAYEHNSGCSFYFTTQTEVDQFSIDHPNLDTIQCDVYIRSETTDPVTDLTGLSQLVAIKGYLWIEKNNSLTSLNGLGNLMEVGKYVQILDNTKLSSIEALNALTSIGQFCKVVNNDSLTTIAFENLLTVGGDLEIKENPYLIDIIGFDNLTTIGGCLDIEANSNLVDIVGFENLLSTDSFINIYNNNNLTILNGFGSLLSTDGYISISSNDSLTVISGFDSLTDINDYLRIYGNYNLSSFQAFVNLNIIDGFFVFSYNDALNSINGFNNLVAVGDDFELNSNISLQEINAFSNLNSIAGDFTISGNGSLDTLSGFNSLVSIEGSCTVRYNYALLTISGFQNLTTLDGNLSLYYNSALIDVTGLSNLTAIGGSCLLRGNTQLTSLIGLQNVNTISNSLNLRENKLFSLEGFSALSSIGSHLTIYRNDSLTSLAGLENLLSIGEYISIENNDALQTISSLSNLNENEVTGLTIRYNDSLSICHSSFVCNYLEIGAVNNIANNAPGCANEQEVFDNCTSEPRIHYPLFFDINENSIKDNGEPFLSCASVLIEPGGYLAYGNPTNGGLKYLSYDSYTISYNQSATPVWELTTTPPSFDFTLSEQNNSETIYFGLHPTVNISNIVTGCVNGNPRCNEFVTFSAFASNTGTTIADGTLWFTVDENIINENFIDPPDTIVSPNRYGWHFTNLFPDEVLKKEISLQFPGPQDFPIGDFLNFETEINYVDVNGSNGFDDYIHTIEMECAYDPNDKLVSPQYPENYALIGEDLIYTVRFQNTGNAEAYDVVITDELDASLDLSTFQYITSSHESVLSTYLEGHTLTFEFRNIFLPDSTTNFDGSQGYVMYSIRPLDTLADFTVVENTANIFFDFNPAVVTNTTENVMLETFDFDEDGFELWNDCDDDNAFINPGEIEIPYNGIDEDCNPETLDQDLDQDGFLLADDCDDNNALVNPNSPEIPYNNLDDDCNEMTLDDDLDQDGFVLADDCDDENPAINMDAEEIPNNGIDEDCDGEDLIIIGIGNLITIEPQVFPNPTSGTIKIILPKRVTGTYELRSINGKILLSGALPQEALLDLTSYAGGVYVLLLETEDGAWIERVVRLK